MTIQFCFLQNVSFLHHNGNGYVENGTFTVHWNPTAERRSFLVPPMGRASDMLNDFIANNAPDA